MLPGTFTSDWFDRVVRVDASTGILTTAAGTLGKYGDDGDGGPAVSAKIGIAYGLAFDLSGNLLISDNSSARIRAVKGPVPAPPPLNTYCDLFSDSFAGGNLNGWAVSSDMANWVISDGKLQVSGIKQDKLAYAEHGLPSSTYFRLSMNVDVETLRAGAFGFLLSPLSQELTIKTTAGQTYPVNGIGIWVSESAKVSLLTYDNANNQIRIFDAVNQDFVSDLGLEWSPFEISLLVNGAERLNYYASQFGIASLDPPGNPYIDLLAAGTNFKIGFSRICQKTIDLSSAGKTSP
jgi:hypothetical protein